MHTLVISVTAMIVLMEPTTDAKEVARCTLSTAQLNVCLHLDDHVVKSSV